ncbi:MAG: DUF3800 domain-containing protein [Candidatus Diapherotrites archaeon]|nr:DUF3800 domain-containing protein [Candidatus Diapherotrites archaeon]
MFQFVFIDESGDLGINGSNYLILAAVIVTEYKSLDRILKNMRRHKFKKELRKASEIKANQSSDAVVKYMLEKLNEVKTLKVFYIVLEKKKILSEYLKNNKDKLYNYVAGKLAKNIILEGNQIEIRIDKSKGKQLLQNDFNNYFLKNLKLKDSKIKPKIFHSNSHSWSGLQFADVLAWACFQKFEHNNSEFIDLIKIEQEVYHVW